ncbi:hypothetical protein SteCoe_34546 [Stentor coeruleus]|uniref:Uncharacterized protein n=1 Tax=Stentor coeruleus TaxID=5963 RepID=A0A1R2AU91_9CILI|nr:hypothetical protein SteCoe_34546 [Stentor coeruleus]
MASTQEYKKLEESTKTIENLAIVSAAIILLLGTSVSTVFSYNPIGTCFSVSIGVWLTGVCYYVYSLISKDKKITLPFPENIYITGVLTSLGQVFAYIAYYYNPMNHGEVTTLLGISAVVPILLSEKSHISQIPGLLAVLIGLGFTAYYSLDFWLHYSFFFAIASVFVLTWLFNLPKKSDSTPKDAFYALTIYFILNVLGFFILCGLGLYPWDEERALVYFGIGSGICIAFACYIALKFEFMGIGALAFMSIGYLQIVIEKFVFGVEATPQLFYPVLPIFIGLEFIALPQIVLFR